MEQYYGGHDLWGQLQDEIRLLQAAQYEHDARLVQHQERLERLEKTHESGTRISSIWSTPSPFPAPLSTYAQRMF